MMQQGYILGALFFAMTPLLASGAPTSQTGRDQIETLKLIKLQTQPVPEEVLPAPAESASPSPAPVEYKNYCIRYWHHKTLRRTCCGCCTTMKTALEVKDPCCCPVLVPICIPGCCKDMPCISTGRDILGRFSYTYEWRCGYKIDVVFRPRGDVMVHSWGR